MKSVWDVNLTYGGPIERDRLWFFATYRAWSANNYLANTFDSQGNQAVDDQRIQDGTLRLTWQAARKHKIAAALRSQRQVARPPAEQLDHRQHQRAGVVGRADHAAQLHRPVEVELAALESAADRVLGVHDAGQLQPLSSSRKRTRTPSPRSIRFARSSRGVSPRQDINTARMFTYAGFVVVRDRRAQFQGRHAGAHRLVAGALRDARRHRADRVQRRAAVGASRKQPERPQGVRRQHAASTSQDSWTLGRVTLNPGVRYERFVMSIPAQSAGAGTLGSGTRVRRAGEHRQLEHASRRGSASRGISSATAARRSRAA